MNILLLRLKGVKTLQLKFHLHLSSLNYGDLAKEAFNKFNEVTFKTPRASHNKRQNLRQNSYSGA